MRSYPGQIPGYPPGGLRAPIGAPSSLFPATGGLFAGQTGITPNSLYLFNEASGSLLDKAGAVDLSANGTPTFAVTVGGRQGIHYDAANDRHQAAAYGLGLNSGIMWAVFSDPAGAAAGIMGGYGAAAAVVGWLLYYAGGVVNFGIRDNVLANVVIASSAISAAAVLVGVGVQVDRAAAVGRMIVGPIGGAFEQVEGSIAGRGTLTAGDHIYGFGAMPFLTTSKVFYGGIRVDADTEGADTLPDLIADLGWAA